MAEASGGSAVLVGVVPSQPDDVVLQAVRFASRFGCRLVCARVDPGRYPVEQMPDGSTASLPFDPDSADLGGGEFDQRLARHLEKVLDGCGVPWETRSVAGEPARALGHLAEMLDAVMIVVGTREATVRGGVRAFFGGSVAAQLAHRQHRPVVVIPLHPVGSSGDLPWERT